MTHPRIETPVSTLVVWLVVTLGCSASPLSAQEPRLRATFTGPTDEVRCVAISPDGRTIASGDDNTIRVWDVASGKERATLKNAAVHWVDSLAFSPDGKILASGIGGGGVRLWDLGTHKDTFLRDKILQFESPLVGLCNKIEVCNTKRMAAMQSARLPVWQETSLALVRLAVAEWCHGETLEEKNSSRT